MAFKLPIDAEIVNSSSYISDGMSLQKNTSSFSLYYEITGNGTVDFFVYTSPDGINFVKNVRALKRGQTKTSGPEDDGVNMIHVPIIPCDAFKIEVEETAGTATTVTAKINLLPGQFGDFPLYDGPTNWVKTIDGAHHEIHEEHHFYMKGFTVLEDGPGIYRVTITTPDTGAWAHFIWSIQSSGILEVSLQEAPSGGMANGSPVTPLNNNRNSDKTSGLVISSGVDVATNAGLELDKDKWGVAGKFDDFGGGSGRTDEIILKQNTIYLRTFTSTSTTNIVQFKASWYEHTNR
jgi:hypothetical protein